MRSLFDTVRLAGPALRALALVPLVLAFSGCATDMQETAEIHGDHSDSRGIRYGLLPSPPIATPAARETSGAQPEPESEAQMSDADFEALAEDIASAVGHMVAAPLREPEAATAPSPAAGPPAQPKMEMDGFVEAETVKMAVQEATAPPAAGLKRSPRPPLPNAPMLRVGEVLSIALTSHATIALRATIDPHGFVALPLIEPLKLAGLSVTEAEQRVRESYVAAGVYGTQLKVAIRP